MVKMQHQPQKDGRYIQYARTNGGNKSLEEDERNWRDRCLHVMWRKPRNNAASAVRMIILLDNRAQFPEDLFGGSWVHQHGSCGVT